MGKENILTQKEKAIVKEAVKAKRQPTEWKKI